jgi:PAS domain S-box-containing protein
MSSDATDVDLAALVHQAPDAIIFADLEGVIRTWNAAAERIFGHAAAEALGQNLDIIIPEQLREAHWTGYDRALAAGDTKYKGQSLPTKAVKADGSQFYVELSFAIIHGPDGAVIGALAHARDITERFERDRTMRRRLRELEASEQSAPDQPGV